METFNTLFDEVVNGNSQSKQNLLDIGTELVRNDSICLNIKEDVLNRLMFVMPEICELDYYLGYIFKDIDFYKAIQSFHKCWLKNRYYIENLLDYTKLLFENDFIEKINELNIDNYFDEIKDPRLMVLNANLDMRKQEYKKASKILLSIINSDNIDNKIKIMAHCNLSWPQVSGIRKGFHLLIKALTLVDNETDIAVIKPLVTDILLFKDYIYPNEILNETVNLAYKMFNLIAYPNVSMYNFDSPKGTKIRIGYVSGDFVDSVITNFTFNIMNNYSSDLFELYIFNCDRKKNTINYIDDDKCIKINISNLSDEEASSVIHSKNIDILIDLAGHTGRNRLGVFRFNPSPIQIAYLGYPNTTGLDFIKYRICDHITDPIDTKQYYSEKLLRLPKCFLLYKNVFQRNFFKRCFRNYDSNSFIVLGSLNKDIKISDELLECWKNILNKNSMTKIIIKVDTTNTDIDITEFYCKELSVECDRIEVIGKVSLDEYYKLFSRIDIFLDTFPYSGTTTTCNALSNSVPVITCYHPDSHVHNVSASLLINSGFPELVAYSHSEYVEKVVNLSKDIDKISYYHETIDKKFNELMEPKQFMMDYEKLLIDAYNDRCLQSH
jgi:predicted O-linked N-acetylglucosamine transferase (SPINDLY family)